MRRWVLVGAAIACVAAAAALRPRSHTTVSTAPSARPSRHASGPAPLQIARTARPFVACRAAAATPALTPELAIVSVADGGRRGCGDGPDLTSVTPAHGGAGATATVRYRLAAPALVSTAVCADRLGGLVPIWSHEQHAGRGLNVVTWPVPPTTATGTYLVSLSAAGAAGSTAVGACLSGGHSLDGPVVRVVGIDAAFERRSYVAGEVARLFVTARAREIHVAAYHVGAGRAGGNHAGARQMLGKLVASSARVAWGSPLRVRRGVLLVRFPRRWPSGLYDLRLSGDGQVGYAPVVIRPRRLGTSRIAVVVPTNTWTAYNFADPDGNGLANTWYAGSLGTPVVRLGLPFVDGGAPPHWYATNYLAWLGAHKLHPDMLTDDDLEAAPDALRLARAYSAIIFAGHEEYVTAHEYDLIEHYRDLGGNVAFLSANSLFWRIDRHGPILRRIAQWRDLGRPEAALVGVQYVANDTGRHRGPYRVVATAAAPWLFRGTHLSDGTTFGSYGVEFDMRASASPAGLHLLARVDPHLPREWVRGDMTIYRRGRSEVFAAGTESFSDATRSPTETRMLENLWRRWASRPPPVGVAGG
jgi:hypothetical protein